MAKDSKKKPTKKRALAQVATKKTPTPAAAKEIKALTVSAQILKVDKPADWPKGAVPNVRAYGPLPDGWHHAKMLTGARSGCSGGKMRPCYIGPRGKLIWHKYTLEKVLGVKLDMPDDVRRPQCLSPVTLTEFPPEAIIRRTDRKLGAKYILDRCDGVAGLCVHHALQTYTYDFNGESCDYGLADLRYDVKAGRLTIETGDAAKKRAVVKPRMKLGAKPTIKMPASSRKKVLAAQPSSSRSPSGGSSRDSCTFAVAGLRHIKSTVLAPLKKHAASGEKGEKDIFSLMGVAHILNMDAIMMKVLPEILRKAPAERGEFGDGVVCQFEAQLEKHL